MSPTMRTFLPAGSGNFSLMVKASNNAWVGWAWAPSPALITEARVSLAIGPGRPERLVAHDDEVGAHGLEGFDGFPNGFALGDGRVGDVEVDDIGGEAFGGDLEGRVGAGAGLVEEHEHGFALEGGDFFHRAGEEFLERDGLIEEVVDFRAIEGGDV